MLNTWNALEKTSIRSKLPRRIDKTRISEGTSTVPDAIKAFYIRARIKQACMEHMTERKAYLKLVNQLKAEFKRNRHNLEADRLLQGDQQEVKLVLPEAPVLYYTLKDEVIQELIEKAQGHRIVWDQIIDGSVQNFPDLKKALRKVN